MDQTKIYNFDGKTGLYLGESWADDSPMEPGVILMPRHATAIPAPDEIPDGSAAFWRSDHWQTEVVPMVDDDLDGVQDAPQGFKSTAEKPGYFKRLVKAIAGKQ